MLKIARFYKRNVSGRVTLLPGTELRPVSFEWCRRSEFLRGRVCFNFVLVEAPTNFNFNSLKADCCSAESVSAVRSAGFLKTSKVLECFRTVYKIETVIYFLARLLGSPRSCP